MIYVDNRVGSVELGPLLKSVGASCEIVSLSSGDFYFTGRGPQGECGVGIERKNIRDLANSLRTGRLSAVQIPAMMETYEYMYLIVEGMFKPGADGMLLEWHRQGWSPLQLGGSRFMYSELFKALNTIQMMTPIKVIRSSTEFETATQIFHLYRWWNDKEWSKHSAHQSFHADGHMETFDPTYIRLVAKELPGVGWEKSKGVEAMFDSLGAMLFAAPDEWALVPGIGKVTAERIWRAIHGVRTRKRRS